MGTESLGNGDNQNDVPHLDTNSTKVKISKKRNPFDVKDSQKLKFYSNNTHTALTMLNDVTFRIRKSPSSKPKLDLNGRIDPYYGAT